MASPITATPGAPSARPPPLFPPPADRRVSSMNRFCSPRLVVALVGALGVLTLATRAPAGDRTHKSQGTARFVSPTDFVGSGQATHLGRYTEVGTVQFTP